MKPLLRQLHLWSSLVFGLILVTMGLSGSVLSWRHPLDVWLNPTLLQAPPPAGMQAGAPLRLDPAVAEAAVARLRADPAYGTPTMLMFPERAGDVFIAWYRPGPAHSVWSQPVTRQVMLDPATLRVTGERNWGEAGLSRPLLMPTLFHLHRYLLAGDGGKVVVAVTGLALALAALSGIVLWWPAATRKAWRHALGFRLAGPWPRLSFQSHRALGFWFAVPLLVSAGSGIHFNMPGWTTPLLALAGPLTPTAKVANRHPATTPLAPADALRLAQARFPAARPSRLVLPASPTQPYEIRLRQPQELRDGDGATRVSIDAGDGAVLKVADPLAARGGDRVVSWLFPLHTGEALGMPGRIAISLLGLTPLFFLVTGVTIWLTFRRRPARPAGVTASGQKRNSRADR